jgi:hypothetical protein
MIDTSLMPYLLAIMLIWISFVGLTACVPPLQKGEEDISLSEHEWPEGL